MLGTYISPKTKNKVKKKKKKKKKKELKLKAAGASEPRKIFSHMMSGLRNKIIKKKNPFDSQ